MYKAKVIKENIIFKIILLNIALALVALVKDIYLAKLLGTSALSDALFVAYFIPDFIGNNLIAVSLGISLIPIFSMLNKKNDQKIFAVNTFSIIMVTSFFLLLLILILIIYKENIIGIVGYGFDQVTIKIAQDLFVVLVPIILFYPLFTIGSSMSNIKNSFLIPAFAPIILNITILIGVLTNYNQNKITKNPLLIISGSIIFGVILMVALVWGNIIRNKWFSFKILKLSSLKNFDFIYFRKLLYIFVPFILMILTSQSVLIFERYFASNIGEGVVSGLSYAFRISQLPVWIFIAGISTYSLPEVANIRDNKNYSMIKEIVIKYLKLTFVLIIPMMLVINIMRNQIIDILFFGKNFDLNSLEITSDILMGYSFVIFGTSIFMIVTRLLVPLRLIKWPLIFTLLTTVCIIVLNIYLIPVFKEQAIGISAAIGNTINGFVLLAYINGKLKLNLKKKMKKLILLLLSNIPVILFAYMLRHIWGNVFIDNILVLKLFIGVLSGIIMVTIYVFMLKITRIYNIDNFMKKLFMKSKEI